jgi:putative radical SAM enzyme (TIGR03279 family)
MITIDQVIAQSAAEMAGIEGGDQLLAVGEKPVEDIVDYFLALESKTSLRLLLRRREDDPFEVQLELGEEEDPGLIPLHPEPASCGNNCVFCFVHQLPKGLRKSLYVKDEDYRFSWLYGSYITLGNIGEDALQRIIADHLSPLYISVHATDEDVRCRMLGKQVAPILPILERLTAAGIELHTQIVLCPGFNDGAVLQRTIDDLAALWPRILSLAVVPVGLTRHRDHLPHLDALSVELAGATLDILEQAQQQQFERTGSRFVFAADELYLRAAREFPGIERYEQLWQLENGVGLLPQFRCEAEEVLLEALPLELERVSLVTGASFVDELESFAARLAVRTEVELQVVPVENSLFGSSVTVTGLLTGADIIAAFTDIDPGAAVLLPDVLFNDGDNLLLDDMRIEDLEQHFKVPVLRVSSDPWGILDGLERLDCSEIEIVHG